MSENKLSISRNAMNYGGMTGIVLFLLFILTGILGSSVSSFITIVCYVALGIGIFIGTKNYRDTELDGSISYGTSFYSGFLISFFASVLIAFAAFLYLKFVDSSLLVKVMEDAESNLMKSYNDDEEKVEKALEIMQVMNNPSAFALMLVLSYTFWGTLLSLVLAAIIKKQPPSRNSFDNFIQQNQ